MWLSLFSIKIHSLGYLESKCCPKGAKIMVLNEGKKELKARITHVAG
jgi:hypothetical protein